MSKSRILLAGAALFTTLICWSLSSPVNSNSDERFHIGSIWCAEGFNTNCKFLGKTNRGTDIAWVNLGLCTPALGGGATTRLLVDRIRNTCRQKNADYSQLARFEESPNFQIESNGYVATNFSQNEFSFYSKIMNQFSSKNGAISVISIRVLNSLVFCCLLVLLLILSPPTISNSILLSLLLISTPLFVFHVASVNPSSWAIAGCSFNWAFLLSIIKKQFKFDLPLIGLTVGWVFSLVISISARYETVIFIIFTNLLAIGIVLIEKPTKTRIYYAAVFASIFLTLSFIVASINSANILRLITVDKDLFYNVQNQFLAIGGTLKILLAIPLRMLGYEQFGWLGTFSPNFVPLTSLLVIGVVIYKQIFKINHRQIIYVICFICFLFLIVYSQIFSQIFKLPPFYYLRTGWRWDSFFTSRYFMPLAIGLLAPLNIFANYSKLVASSDDRHVIINLLPFAHTVSLYSIGQHFRDNPNWFWSDLSYGNDIILLFGSLSFFVFTYTVMTSKHLSISIIPLNKF